jgi:hypothetical protein
MEIVSRSSSLWRYLTPEIKGLISDGEAVLGMAERYKSDPEITDYSFIVFSFAKAYEGFLKKFLLDSGLIKEGEYYGDDLRIGRVLNPHYISQKGNIFSKICDRSKGGREFSTNLWRMWKRGRNTVFHYFPHNFRKLEYEEALKISEELIEAMERTLNHCDV